ncbi:MAG: response regulator [Candidatus Thermoplasmatota archaeon]|jgi:FixJ family two-component response regulator|nr:response regulator [Candidatus Thermoplasmatota archaeon]
MKTEKRILVVDDDKFIRKGLSELLSREGFFVDTAPNGEVALGNVRDNIYNLILTDIKMSGMDGLELLRKIKKFKPYLNVILITAYATVDIAIEAMKYGASDFIRKPFSIDNIIRVVKINTHQMGDFIKEEKLVHNETRDRIHDFISTNPGEHYRSIQTKLQLGNGVLNYHLHILEKKKLIKANKDGIYKRYYPMTLMIPRGGNRRLSKTQEKIVKLINERPGILQQDISNSLRISRQLTSYHVRQLMRNGTLKIIKDGNQSRLWLD